MERAKMEPQEKVEVELIALSLVVRTMIGVLVFRNVITAENLSVLRQTVLDCVQNEYDNPIRDPEKLDALLKHVNFLTDALPRPTGPATP